MNILKTIAEDQNSKEVKRFEILHIQIEILHDRHQDHHRDRHQDRHPDRHRGHHEGRHQNAKRHDIHRLVSSLVTKKC